jgi:Na+/H+-dicarboxylate symporter
MVRTATNVAGQSVVPILVSAREGILDRVAFASHHVASVSGISANETAESENQAVAVPELVG